MYLQQIIGVFKLLPKVGIQNDYDKTLYRRQTKLKKFYRIEKEKYYHYFIFIYMCAIGKILKKLFLFYIFIYVILYNI